MDLQDTRQQAGILDDSGGPQRSRYTLLAIAIGLAGLVVVAQFLAPWTDHQVTNIASAVLLCSATTIFLIWWIRTFRDAPWIQLAPICLIAVSIGVFVSLFRFNGVSGELVPIFVRRTVIQDIELPDLSKDPVVDLMETSDEGSPQATFSGFLGDRRDGIIASREFALNWDSKPPKLDFRQPIGEGWSGFAIVGPVGFTLEQRGEEEWTTCYDLVTGRLQWRHVERARHEHALGGVGPRATPVLSGSHVVSCGATGIVICLEAATGNVVWRADLLQMANLTQEESEALVTWGRSGSPLIIDEMVVLPLGGSGPSVSALVALDLRSGTEKWRSHATPSQSQESVADGSQISYASPIVAKVLGANQIVAVNESLVAGYSPVDGMQLWSHDWPGSSNGGANCSQPTVVGEDILLLSKGYGGGGLLLKIQKIGDGYELSPIWQMRSVLKTKFTNPIVHDGFVYALSDGILECIELMTGTRRWRQPRSDRYRHGQMLLVEDVLLVLTEDGRVAIVELNPDEFNEIASIQAIQGKTWNIPSLAGRRLVVRNSQELASYLLPERR